MKKLFFLLIATQFSVNVFSQMLDLKSLIKAYNSTSVKTALGILQAVNGFEERAILTSRSGDSVIVVYFGQDSLIAKKQRGKIIIYCSAFKDEAQFKSLKQQASGMLKTVDVSEEEELGILRTYIVYGENQIINPGEFSVVLTKCYDKERSLTYFQLDIYLY